MISHEDRKRLLVVSLKKEAQPVLGELRGSGHQVSLVEDLDEAQALLASGGFDQALVSARDLAALLEQRLVWEGIESDEWRRSAAGITHDLRYLLRALQQSVEALQRRETISELDLIQVSRTVSMLSDFLLELTGELSGGAASELSVDVVDLEDLVETAAMAVYPIASERRQRLAIDIDSAVAHVRVDPVKTKRALTQLLTHASTQSPSVGLVKVRAWSADDGCIVSVSFPGQTLSAVELKGLFAPLFDSAHPSAPNLSTVHRLVQQHGGSVWVESQLGSDTAIFVSLPHCIVEPETNLAALAID